MAKARHYIPDRARAVTPYLVVHDGRAALAWYEKVLGARIESVMDGPNDAVMHAELRVAEEEGGDFGSQIYLAQEFPGMPGAESFVSPKTLGGASATIHLYVTDVDAVHRRALAEGATEIQAPTDQFWGDRHSSIVDPFGHRWGLATHIEDLTPEELERRARDAAAQFAEGAGPAEG